MLRERELLFSVTKKDLVIQTFQSGGKGGQHQNKTSSGVRIIHLPSGARGGSRNERSQRRNKHLAFRRLAATREFRLWQSRVVWEVCNGKSIDQCVEEGLAPENIKVEIKVNGKWVVLGTELRIQ